MNSWSGSQSQQQNKDYYENNMIPPHPNLIPLEPYSIMNTRYRKIVKLNAQKEHSLARKRQQIHQEQKIQQNNTYNILHHLQNSRISEMDSNQEDILYDSYDSDVHDIYEGGKLQSRFREVFSMDSQQNILDVRLIKQSGLILDFKPVQIGKNLNNVSNNHNQGGLNTSRQMQTQNTSSQYIKISSPQAKNVKKGSFIGYYNSLSKKQSSNIIQKYIKSKK